MVVLIGSSLYTAQKRNSKLSPVLSVVVITLMPVPYL